MKTQKLEFYVITDAAFKRLKNLVFDEPLEAKKIIALSVLESGKVGTPPKSIVEVRVVSEKNFHEFLKRMSFPEVKRAKIMYEGEFDEYNKVVSECNLLAERCSRAEWAMALAKELRDGQTTGSWKDLVEAVERVERELLKQAELDKK